MEKNKAEFAAVIKDLTSGNIYTGLNDEKMRVFPRFVYHFTDINNAISILKKGSIYSRNSANKNSIMAVDNASKAVIDHTNEDRKDYVRFYFRPKTPTQYINEGVRALNQINTNLNAHCPVPIFFLFDSLEMLSLENSYFTYGNFANHDTSIYNDPNSFRDMPFNYVYHEGWYDRMAVPQIKFHRHAELIVQNKCDLTYLKHIVCRSKAEKETFLNLLDESLREQYKDIISLDSTSWFYNSTWTFVENVNLTSEKIRLSFNIHSDKPSFHAKCIMQDLDSPMYETWEHIDYKLSETETLTFTKPYKRYSIRYELNDHVVYLGSYTSSDSMPF